MRKIYKKVNTPKINDITRINQGGHTTNFCNDELFSTSYNSDLIASVSTKSIKRLYAQTT